MLYKSKQNIPGVHILGWSSHHPDSSKPCSNLSSSLFSTVAIKAPSRGYSISITMSMLEMHIIRYSLDLLNGIYRDSLCLYENKTK